MWAALWDRIRRLVRPLAQTPAQRQGREADVQVDPAQPPLVIDGPFVGRIGGEDAGGAEDTIARKLENEARRFGPR
jgi:hypothetical protein